MSKHSLLDQIIVQAKKTNNKQTEKQKRIIESAIKLFAEKGYSNTSTSEIAKVAEVSEGTIFKHYGTKDKLLLSLILPYIKEFLPSIADEVFSEIINDTVTTFEEFLRAFLNNRIQFIAENRELFQIVIKEMIYKEELKNELLPYFFEIANPRMTKIVNHFKGQGELIDIPTEKMVNMLLTFIGGFIASRFVLLNKEYISEEEMEEAIRFVLNGISKRNLSKIMHIEQ